MPKQPFLFSSFLPSRLAEAEFVFDGVEEAVHHRAHVARLQHPQPHPEPLVIRLPSQIAVVLHPHEHGVELPRSRRVRVGDGTQDLLLKSW